LSASGDEKDCILPPDLVMVLKDRLEVVEVLTDEEENSPALSIMISEAFTKFFLGLIGDLSQFIKHYPKRAPSFQVLLK
jgi:hypothetical protein